MANNLDYSSWLGRIHSRIDPFSLLHFPGGFDLNAIYLNNEIKLQKEIKSLQFDTAVADKNLTCPICLDPLEDNAVKLPMCQHCYHRDCITEWLKQKLVCPVCYRDFPSSHITYAESTATKNTDRTRALFVLLYENGQITYDNGRMANIELYNLNSQTNQPIAEDFSNEENLDHRFSTPTEQNLDLLYQAIAQQLPNLTQGDLITALINNQNDYIEALSHLTADKNRAYEIFSQIPYRSFLPAVEEQNILTRVLTKINTYNLKQYDIELILNQTDCSITQAIETLYHCNGDIVNAIMELTI